MKYKVEYGCFLGHNWYVRRVSVPMFDPRAKGILKTCNRCDKVVAK